MTVLVADTGDVEAGKKAGQSPVEVCDTLTVAIRDHAEIDVPDTSQDAVDKLYRDTRY